MCVFSQLFLKIFEYLDIDDILNVTQTCRKFFQIISQHKSISDQFLLKVTNENLDILRNCSRNFNFRFKYENFYDFEKFNSRNIEELFIERIHNISFVQLMTEILKMENLKKLVIRESTFERGTTIPSIETKLSLTSLVLDSNIIFNNQMDSMLSAITNLTKFDYRNDREANQFNFQSKPEFFSTLKELNLHCLNCDILKNKNFNLNKFSLNCQRPTINLKNLEIFLTKQTNLTYLGVNFTPNNYSQLFNTMKTVCNKLQNLNYISFDFGHQTIVDFNDFDFVWNLKGIEIRFPPVNFFNDLKIESKIEDLHIGGPCLQNIFNRFNFLPNLICLFLYRTKLDNSDYQAIFQHLLQLRELRIFYSQLVSLNTELKEKND